MRNIIIKNIEISNFKGLRSLVVDFSPTVTDIYGENATGKTTIFDALLWLLFDKDSSGAKQFNVKPLGADGQTAQKGVEPTVTALVDADGRDVRLQKVYTEKWTKKRGSSDVAFEGHETKYFVDGVPKKKGEYEDYVSGLVDERLFRLLTDVTFFNAQLHWQERRKLLLEMCGDVSDAGVIDANEGLKPLRGELTRYSIDDLKKKLAAERTRINKEREELPVRIDEAYRSIVEGIDEKAERAAIEGIGAQIALLESEKEILGDADAVAIEIRKVEGKMLEVRSENDRHVAGERAKFDRGNLEIRNTREEFALTLRTAEGSLSRGEAEIEGIEYRLNQLRTRYQEIKAEEWAGDHICPACGQALPDDSVAGRIEQFNLQKTDRLTKNQEEGKELARRLAKLKADCDDIRGQITTVSIRLENAPEEGVFCPVDMPGYQEAMDELTQKKAALSLKQRRELEDESLKKRDEEIAVLREELKPHEGRLLQLKNNEAQRARIEELEAKEKELAKAIGEVDKQLHLTDEFTKAKVRMLEDKINGTFRLARFKLFDQQINSGISECCEAAYNGVPYADLNNAMRINIGIDIINALAAHYGISAPLVIDNAESVTDLLPAAGQVIRLVVSSKDKALRVERAGTGAEGEAVA